MPAPKALLSYASSEGGFASQLAKRLERGRIPFERRTVRAEGPNLTNLTGWSRELVVVILSQESLSSYWARSPLETSERLRWSGTSRDLLVLVVDSIETLANLPYWLRAGVAIHAKTPAQAFNAISSQLAVLETGSRAQPLFVGREQEVSQLANKVAPPLGTNPPSVILVHGLEGVGRRSFLGHVMRNYLSLTPGPFLHLRNTDSLDWLHVLLVQEAREIREQRELATVTEHFQGLPEHARIRELVALLKEVSVGRRAPIIVDSGALIEETGSLRPEASQLFAAIQDAGGLRVGVVMSRAPRIESSLSVAVHRLGPLTREATRLLLTQEFREVQLECDSSQVSQLATWVAGYPPAVGLIVSAVQQRGLNSVLADDAALRDLTLRLFVPLLDRLSISRPAWEILRILAPFGALPAEVVAELCEQSIDDIQPVLTELAERNILMPSAAGLGISPPLRVAVVQRAGIPDEASFSRIAQALKSRYDVRAQGDELLPIEVVEALTIAVARSDHAGQEIQFGAYGTPSTLVRLASEAYMARHWGRALQYAERAAAADPRREEALVIQLKAHVRLGHWDKAQDVLARVEQHGPKRRHYLRGFIAWKQRDWTQAVDSFRAAIQSGDRSMSVRRDLATCLFMLGKLSEARQELEQIDDRAASSNRFVLDLMAHILIRLGNFDGAQLLIDQLKRHGFRADYLHRLAHLRLAQEQPDEALEAAEEALRLAPYRRESLWLKAEALVLLGRVDEARIAVSGLPVLTKLDADIKRAMLAIVELKGTSDWHTALDEWAHIQSKNNDSVKRLRVRALEFAIQDGSTTGAERRAFEEELSHLRSDGGDLDGIPAEFAVLAEG